MHGFRIFLAEPDQEINVFSKKTIWLLIIRIDFDCVYQDLSAEEMVDTENVNMDEGEGNAQNSASRDHANQAGLETANVGVPHRAWGTRMYACHKIGNRIQDWKGFSIIWWFLRKETTGP